MKLLIKLILFIPLIIIAGFIVWMNLTPGYFRYGDCFCKVGYFTNQQIETDRQNLQCHLIDCKPPSTIKSWLWKLELNLAKLDFNRGPKTSTSVENSSNVCEIGRVYRERWGDLACQCPDGYELMTDCPQANPRDCTVSNLQCFRVSVSKPKEPTRK